MPNLGDYIIAVFPFASGQLITDMNEIGTYTRGQVNHLYTTLSIDDSPTLDPMKNSVTYANTPIKNSNTISYYLIQRFSEAFDIQQAAANLFFTPTPPAVPPPPPPITVYPYVPQVVKTYIENAILVDIQFLYGLTYIVNIELKLLIAAFDNFIADVYLTT